MTLVEVLPDIQSLSRLDKIRLIQFLAQDLERDDGDATAVSKDVTPAHGGLIENGHSYPVFSPDREFSAAAAMLAALAEDQGQR